MKNNFPRKIYVKWVTLEGEKEPFMGVATEAESLAEAANETIEVGVFELKETGTLTTQPSFWLKGLPKRS